MQVALNDFVTIQVLRTPVLMDRTTRITVLRGRVLNDQVIEWKVSC